ncbi:MAG: DNA-3-methyladenine glycosylase 2 family protein [Verrucomicrobiaceae bacterium]|nr:DNA-3-methyladenine glycosylase 2 family protein [Verrucomicrobiaceae bacterium]
MPYFPITQKALNHISSVDKQLAEIIATYPKPKRLLYSSAFECIVSCIIQQQISGKTAEKIFTKIKAQLQQITPQNIIQCGIQNLNNCGVPERKATTISNIAQASINETLNFEEIANLPENEIIKILSAYKGIGAWTIEMLLIFALKKTDIFSTKDFGIKRGFYKLHPNANINEYKKRYSPYGTTASIYLWEIK